MARVRKWYRLQPARTLYKPITVGIDIRDKAAVRRGKSCLQYTYGTFVRVRTINVSSLEWVK